MVPQGPSPVANDHTSAQQSPHRRRRWASVAEDAIIDEQLGHINEAHAAADKAEEDAELALMEGTAQEPMWLSRAYSSIVMEHHTGEHPLLEEDASKQLPKATAADEDDQAPPRWLSRAYSSMVDGHHSGEHPLLEAEKDAGSKPTRPVRLSHARDGGESSTQKAEQPAESSEEAPPPSAPPPGGLCFLCGLMGRGKERELSFLGRGKPRGPWV